MFYVEMFTLLMGLLEIKNNFRFEDLMKTLKIVYEDN